MTASDGVHRPHQKRTEIEIQDIVATASGGPHRPDQTERVLSLQTNMDLAPRPGLEPGTCGLTVRPVIARKAAPVNDLGQHGG